MMAISMLGFGLLLFLALISYTPDDLPSWVGFSRLDTPADPINNFIGPVGAIIAGYTYFIFGAAAYLIPTGMIWFGLARFFFEARISKRGMIGFAALVISGACLLHFQGAFFQAWHDIYNIPGAGGGMGRILGGSILVGVIGGVGAAVLMLIVYLASVVMVTGFHPIHFGVMCRNGFLDYVDAREERKLAAATEAERLERQRKKLEREQKKLEKQLEAERKKNEKDKNKNKNTAGGRKVRAKQPEEGSEAKEALENELPLAETEAEVGEPEVAEEEAEAESIEPELPEPKIIDASVRRAAVAEGSPKPSLAEVLKRNKPKKGENEASYGSSVDEISFPDYELPEFELLDFDTEDGSTPADRNSLLHTQNVIIDTLGSFGIKVSAGDITRGPTITRYEIYPSAGLRVSRITQLEADIARATKAERINILAPIPGKDTVGIEIANSDKIIVQLRELLEDPEFSEAKHKIPLALGKDVYGNTIVGDLARMPHLLVAGATGAGKSVCINSIIASILFRFTPDELRFIMVDPKVVEMQMYNSLPHLIVPVVTDPKKVLVALRWVVNEMERRYRLFAEVNVRNFEGFNGRETDDGATAKGSKKGAEDDEHPEFNFDEPEEGAADAEYEEEEEFVDETDEGAEGKETAEGDEDEEWEYVYEYVDEDEEEPGSAFGSDDGGGDEDEEWEYVEVEEEYEEEEEAEAVTPAVSSKEILTTHAVQISPSMEFDGASDAAPAEESVEDDGEKIPERLPYIVVIIDELADLMQTAPADVEGLIARIAQKARAVGIHLIIATQTPRADVVTGIIKANIPSRIAFQVSSSLDSRVILDSKGAEKLVGKGDMLYLPPGVSQLTRAQGALISDQETLGLVKFCAEQGDPRFEPDMEESLSGDADCDEEVSDEDEEIIEKCLEVIETERRASTSLLQRRLRLGYTRAARMMDILEMRGIIGPGDGAKPREILVDFSE